MDIQLDVDSLSQYQLDKLYKDMKHSMPHKPVSLSSKEKQLLIVNATSSHYINLARYINYMPGAVRDNFIKDNRMIIGACILHWHENMLRSESARSNAHNNVHTALINYDEYFKSLLTLSGFTLP